MITFAKKVGVGPLLGRAKVYLLAANVYPQDELRGARKVELLRGNKVGVAHLRCHFRTRRSLRMGSPRPACC